MSVDHPERGIKHCVGVVLQTLSPLFDDLHEDFDRPSIPPKQLLRARVLSALYSVRNKRFFCEKLGDNPFWPWLLDCGFGEGSLKALRGSECGLLLAGVDSEAAKMEWDVGLEALLYIRA